MDSHLPDMAGVLYRQNPTELSHQLNEVGRNITCQDEETQVGRDAGTSQGPRIRKQQSDYWEGRLNVWVSLELKQERG